MPHERLWSYHDAGQAVEGIPESKLKEMIATGQLKRNTLVWSPPMTYWEKASGVKMLLPDFSQSPQPVVRFFARIFDLLIYSYIVSVFIAIASLLFPSLFSIDFSSPGTIAILSIIIICTWTVPESFFISAFGTTPAKWICNIWISEATGKKLPLAESFSRSMRVTIEGMAIGIPILYLLTIIRSYDILNKTGLTPWDRDGHYVVSHGRIGPVRVIALLGLFGLYILDRILFVIL